MHKNKITTRLAYPFDLCIRTLDGQNMRNAIGNELLVMLRIFVGTNVKTRHNFRYLPTHITFGGMKL